MMVDYEGSEATSPQDEFGEWWVRTSESQPVNTVLVDPKRGHITVRGADERRAQVGFVDTGQTLDLFLIDGVTFGPDVAVKLGEALVEWGRRKAGESPVIHIEHPETRESFCDQPVKLITQDRDPRPVCITCYRGIMGWRFDQIQRAMDLIEEYGDQIPTWQLLKAFGPNGLIR